jgi:Tfp pilus assembly protein PilF
MKTKLSFLLPTMQAVVLALLTGCASVDLATVETPKPAVLTFADAAFYGERPAIPREEELLWLTAAQQAAFLAFLNDPALQTQPVNARVFAYLEQFTAGFNYQGDTLSASDGFARNAGNCMSLALMTTALADLAGIHIGYQLLDDVPVFEYRGTIVQKGYHVRSILYDNKERARLEDGVFVYNAGIKVDYFKSEQERFVANLSRAAFIAMYYSNIASDAIAAQDYNKAYWYARESLVHAPQNPAAINMLAVISNRKGDAGRAEALYLFGIAHADEKLSLLKNYHGLLQSQGRQEEALQIATQLERMDDPSPFHWVQLARTATDAKEFEAAIRYYRRALELAPYMHEAYLELAKSQHEAGLHNAAISSLSKALENVYRPGTRKLYKAKLYSLMNTASAN